MVDEPPGLTFHLERADKLPPGNEQMVARANVLLSAEIYDESIWDAVKDKLHNEGRGMRIHTVASFAEEMVDVVKDRLTDAEKAYQRRLSEKEEEIARLRQQLEFANAELKVLKEAHVIRTQSPGNEVR